MNKGDRVAITNQAPNASGVIREVNTWNKVNGGKDKGVCYLIESVGWQFPKWIDAGNVTKEEKTP